MLVAPDLETKLATIATSLLKDQRTDREDDLPVLLSALLPQDVRITMAADRGFADSKLFVFLKEELGFDYRIRLRANIYVEVEGGELRKDAGL